MYIPHLKGKAPTVATSEGSSQEIGVTLAENNSNPRDGTLERGWWPLSRVAKEYLHVNPNMLRGAINEGALKAYAKPITTGRKDSKRPIVLVHLDDVDAWVRSWPRATF